MIEKEIVEKTLVGLKDFQRKTVEYVLHQFDSGRTRMLIADEVGLGKTIVAKGIIAKLFQKHVLEGKVEQFNVIYICSNQAIAKANIGKLNFTGDSEYVTYKQEDDRITSLAYSDNLDNSENKLPFTIKAFTPATSFDDKTHSGRKDERILLYRLLYEYTEIYPYSNSLKWILKGNNKIAENTWDREIINAENGYGRKIRNKVRSEFRKKMNEKVFPHTLPKSFESANLKSGVKYWTLIKKLCELNIQRNSPEWRLNFQRELISNLRFTLSKACLNFLSANIFILDEFQRYKKIIESDLDNSSAALELAKAIFDSNGVKVLMLSATPFKAYTTDFDEINGEVHYKEFETVLRFLNSDCNSRFWEDYQKKRRDIFSFLRHPQTANTTIESVKTIKNDLEAFYRQCIVRTERSTFAKNKDSLIKPVLANNYIEPDVADIEDFIAFDKITQHLNKEYNRHLPTPLEFVKSSPFPLSFLEGYQHRRQLMELISNDNDLQALLKKQKHAWVNIKHIAQYKPISTPIPNGKLRLLLKETIDNGAWKLLWIPPSIPYYSFRPPFSEMQDFSKVIVFSSWILVPRMISTLVSYEAERMSVGNPESISKREKEFETRSYFVNKQSNQKRHPLPQIVYKIDKDKNKKEIFSQPLNISYLYPSISLAKLYDPAENIFRKQSLNDIINEIKNKLVGLLKSKEIKDYLKGSGDWQTWYWAAPLILDKIFAEDDIIKQWLDKGLPSIDIVTDSEDESQQRSDRSGKSKYFNRMRDFYNNPVLFNLPALKDKHVESIAEYLTALTLGSPSICYLRTQLRYENVSVDLLDSSFEVASAFVTCFNKPESIAIMRLTTSGEHSSYLNRILDYSISGNIQSLLDEYYTGPRKLDNIYDLLSIKKQGYP